MSQLKAIKLRIKSVQNTRKITKAMKVVSVSKLRQAQTNIQNARPYSSSLKTMVQGLYSNTEIVKDKFFTQREGGKALTILITSDKGLCGALNSNVLKYLPIFLEEQIKPNFTDHSFVAFGKKGADFLKNRKLPVAKSFVDIPEKKLPKELLDYVRHALILYSTGEINALFIVHSYFVSLMKSEVKFSKILPISIPSAEDAVDTLNQDYIYEPDKNLLLKQLVPLYAENLAIEALYDNIAGEHSSRMVAMDAATKNAGEMIKKLQLRYNRARQSAITTELIEIISGAEATVN